MAVIYFRVYLFALPKRDITNTAGSGVRAERITGLSYVTLLMFNLDEPRT